MNYLEIIEEYQNEIVEDFSRIYPNKSKVQVKLALEQLNPNVNWEPKNKEWQISKKYKLRFETILYGN